MALTALLGIAYMGLAINLAFRREVLLPDGAKYFINFQANQFLYYVQLLTASQGWLFAVRYWKSAVLSSTGQQFFTVATVDWIGLAIGLFYTVAQTTYYLWKSVAFPGYYNQSGS